MRYFYNLLLILFLASCSGLDIKVLNERDYYSEDFLKKVHSIQIIYRDGDKQLALDKLNAISDEKITEGEKAKKYNLKGVMLFSMGDVDHAIENFQIAKMHVKKDLFLANNIELNLASTFYKKNMSEKAMEHLEAIDVSYLKEKELYNYHKLSFTTANQFEKHDKVVRSLIYLMKDLTTFKEVGNFKYKEVLVGNFKKLNDSARVYILDQTHEMAPTVCAYLAREEAMQRFYQGNHDGAEDIVDWLAKTFPLNNSVKKFVEDYRFRLENYSKINSKAVGLVVPLSGKLGRYGRKAIAGVNTALFDQKTQNDLKVFVKDNANNEFLAKKQIQELAINQNVAVIIGGLFPQLAKAEYLEAKKYGVLYISLSPVYLPRGEKNHLLVEVPGSVESQIAEVTRPEVLEKFGKRVSVLYPWSDVGQSYVDEFWTMHGQEKIELVNAAEYQKGILDYREPVKGLLGLKYPRERKEEFKLWNEIKNVNKRKVRIVNVLPPVVDFDWVFVPALPREALQIIPTFSFYDVKGMKFVGGPSWINKKIQREKRNFSAHVYVVGHDTNKISADFIKKYQDKNGKKPHLVDTLSYESGLIISQVLSRHNFEEREELEKMIRSLKSLKGMSFEWNFNNGLWLKKMDLLEVHSSGFSKVI